MIVQHIAAAYDRMAQVQRCERCGAVLKDNDIDRQWKRTALAPSGEYPVGAIIETGPNWQAMLLGEGRGVPCHG